MIKFARVRAISLGEFPWPERRLRASALPLPLCQSWHHWTLCPPSCGWTATCWRASRRWRQRVIGKAIDDRGQPTEPRPPPAKETSIRVYTVAETAKILRLGLTKTYDNIISGRIPAIKLGGRWLVPHEALVRLLQGVGG